MIDYEGNDLSRDDVALLLEVLYREFGLGHHHRGYIMEERLFRKASVPDEYYDSAARYCIYMHHIFAPYEAKRLRYKYRTILEVLRACGG
ncbi:hypothetical protein GWI33_005374 [Rhynchophorus ferrugineus]|uniref:Uncharacterized protein n=1 Tax=Rhynchophorus ferrugineus TaxID=354439 RepID=A0A834ILQ5_RHYFE|nr:hypothetical protein GWI33_005374 [Rhynchophorus ferrugineus]